MRKISYLDLLVGQYVKYLRPIQLFYYYKRRLTLHILLLAKNEIIVL